MPAASPSRQRPLEYPRHVVTAVLVSHDGARWLPEAVAALQWQRRPPQRILAVDTGSSDGSRAILERELGPESVIDADAQVGFGTAVATALDALAGAPEPPMRGRAGGVQSVQWVWLIHDDCAPANDALRHLLARAEESPSAAIIGPKVHSWAEPGLIVEVGFSVDTSGRRETGLERREVDQGQHDSVDDVLAVGTAGALIRRDVLESLGGFDPALALFRDDLDLCWRAHLAGHRVVVAPRAVVRHVEAARHGLRRLSATADRPARVDRTNALYSLLVNLSAPALVFALPRLFVGGLIRALLLLLGKRPGVAGDEMAALWSVVRHPGRIAAGRRKRALTRTQSPRAIRPFLTGRSVRLRHYADAAAGWVADRLRTETSEPSTALETGPTTEEEDLEVIGAGRLLRRLLIRPGPLLVIGLTILALVAERSLLGPGTLSGGRLLPAPAGASDLWSTFVASWHPAGQGSGSAAPPYLAVLAGLSALLFGKAWLAVDVLLLGAVPLAGLSAYIALGRLTTAWPVRVWGAATYALLPVSTAIVAGGRVGDALAYIVLPPLVLACLRVVRSDPRYDGWRHVWVAVLLLTIVAACAPLLYVIALPTMLAATFAVRLLAPPTAQGGAVRRAIAAVILAVTPALLLWPWTASVIAHPSLLVRVPGPAVPGLTAHRLHPLDVLLAAPGGPGTPPMWLTIPLLAGGLAGLLRLARRSVARVAWSVVVAALVSGIVVAHVRVTGDAGQAGAVVVGWPGMATAVVGAGLVVGCLVAVLGFRERLRRMPFGWRQPLSSVVAMTAAVVPVALAVAWLAAGAAGPIDRTKGSVLPAFVAAQTASGSRPAVLILRRDEGAVRYDVVTSRPPRLGDADIPPSRAERVRLGDLVADLAAGRGTDAPAGLATEGVGFVLAPSPVDAVLRRTLDATAGLTRVGTSTGVALWSVGIPTGRAVVLPRPLADEARHASNPDPATALTAPPVPLDATAASVRTRVPAGASGRLVVLADPAGSGWHATVNGRPIARTTAWGWAQAFRLPTAGGELHVWHDSGARHLALAIEGVLVGAVVVLAWPTVRRRDDVAATPAQREADDSDLELVPEGAS